MNDEARKLPGMRRRRRRYRSRQRSRRPYRSNQYWVRRRETDVQSGCKHDTWYGVEQELGTNNQPARNILRNAVYNNIDEIRRIQGQYLSAIEDENRAIGLISEEE